MENELPSLKEKYNITISKLAISEIISEVKNSSKEEIEDQISKFDGVLNLGSRSDLFFYTIFFFDDNKVNEIFSKTFRAKKVIVNQHRWISSCFNVMWCINEHY
jgi:hypothetical protein